MIKDRLNFSRFSSFKIVLIYAIVSAVYIFSSDYFLEIFVKDIVWLSQLQTYKGLGFILVTAGLLYILVKRNLDTNTNYYQQLLEVKKISDAQLVQSREEYMMLFNHSPLPMWIFDLDTLKILHVNENALAIYGYSVEEYTSMTIIDIHHPEDRQDLQMELLNANEKDSLEIPHVLKQLKKNGETIEVKLKSTLVSFNNHKMRLASATDVTEEITIQSQLLDSNSKLKAASEIAGLGYWTFDIKSNHIQWSEKMYEIFEVQEGKIELKLENLKWFYDEPDRVRFNLDLLHHLKGENIFESERKITTQSGKQKWILERNYIIRDQNNNPIKLEGITVDITKRKLQQQEIQESNERFKIISKATVEAIVDWDIKNKAVFWGEGFQTLLGYETYENDLHLWSNNIYFEDRQRVLDDLKQTLNDPLKHNFYASYRFNKANGEIAYVQHRGILLRDENGVATRALGAIIDLTETLLQMQKIESQNKALSEISWTQSHIVRAPLANLMGLVSLLKENHESGISNAEIIDYIDESANKLDEIIRDIVRKTN